MERQLCQHVTGHARVRTATSTKRFGDQLDDGRWEILCPDPAVWWVSGYLACDGHLAPLARLRLADLDGAPATTTLTVDLLDFPTRARA